MLVNTNEQCIIVSQPSSEPSMTPSRFQTTVPSTSLSPFVFPSHLRSFTSQPSAKPSMVRHNHSHDYDDSSGGDDFDNFNFESYLLPQCFLSPFVLEGIQSEII